MGTKSLYTGPGLGHARAVPCLSASRTSYERRDEGVMESDEIPLRQSGKQIDFTVLYNQPDTADCSRCCCTMSPNFAVSSPQEIDYVEGDLVQHIITSRIAHSMLQCSAVSCAYAHKLPIIIESIALLCPINSTQLSSHLLYYTVLLCC